MRKLPWDAAKPHTYCVAPCWNSPPSSVVEVPRCQVSPSVEYSIFKVTLEEPETEARYQILLPKAACKDTLALLNMFNCLEDVDL